MAINLPIVQLLILILIGFIGIATCQWPQQKFDEFRTNRFGFRKSHANWENGNICPNNDAINLSDFKLTFVFSSKQGKAFGLVSDSKTNVKLVQVDLVTGFSTSFTKFAGLPDSVSSEQTMQGILTPSQVYVNVLTFNNTYPVIVKFDTLNNFKTEFKVLLSNQAINAFDIVYSERHDILIVCTMDLVLGVSLSELEIVWQVPNLGDFGNVLLVSNEYGDGNDMVYIGCSNKVYRLNVRTGQPTSPVFSNQKYSLVSMSHLGIPGWIVVASVEKQVSGGDFMTIINIEKNFGKQSEIMFHPWENVAGGCSSPTGNVTKVDANNFIFDISIVCKDARVQTNLIGITAKASNFGNIDIEVNYRIPTDGFGLAAVGNGVVIVKSEDYLLVNKVGQVVKKVESEIDLSDDCDIAVSTNGKAYSVCSVSGSLVMESVDLQ